MVSDLMRLKYGHDAEAVVAAREALFGHHPERGGPELDQAAYAVVLAVRPIIEKECGYAPEA